MTTLEQLAIEANKALIQKKWRLATAESCTGGGIGYWMTSVPGSSACYECGFITYSNEAKMKQLGVKALSLDNFGAVSEIVVREMAEGTLENSSADVSIAITGIAGPGCGTTQKPVGTVWIGIASREKPTLALVDLFEGDRQQVRDLAMIKALNLLITYMTD